MNTAYKHLDAKLRFAELTIGQWAALGVAVTLMVVYATDIHPLSGTFTLVTTVYLGALPIGVVLLAGFSEIDLWLLLRSAVRWRRWDARYLPGPGDDTSGYALHDSTEGMGPIDPGAAARLNLDTLWER